MELSYFSAAWPFTDMPNYHMDYRFVLERNVPGKLFSEEELKSSLEAERAKLEFLIEADEWLYFDQHVLWPSEFDKEFFQTNATFLREEGFTYKKMSSRSELEVIPTLMLKFTIYNRTPLYPMARVSIDHFSCDVREIFSLYNLIKRIPELKIEEGAKKQLLKFEKGQPSQVVPKNRDKKFKFFRQFSYPY